MKAAFPSEAWALRRHLARVPGAAWLDDVALGLVWLVSCLPFLRGRLFVGGDSLAEFYPQTKFIVASLMSGQLPWWNPYEFGGLPVLADPQGMVFTPQTLAMLATGGWLGLRVFGAVTLGAPLLGALALRRYVARYSDTRVLPVLGAAVFMLGGVATSRLQHVPQIDSYSLVPMQLLAMRALILSPTGPRAAALAAALLAGLLNLNQVTFLSAFALLPMLAFHLLESPRRLKAVSYAGLAGLAAVAAACPVISAIAEFLPLSNHVALSVADSAGASFPLSNLGSLFLPGLYGVASAPGQTWEPTDASQDYLYIGVVPFAITLLAFWRAPKTHRLVATFPFLAAFWFVFAMGVHTPVYRALFACVLGLNAFRRPADGAFLMNFMAALTIGSFQAGWLGRPAERATRLQVVISGLVLGTLGIAVLDARTTAALMGHGRDMLAVWSHLARRALVIVGLCSIALAARGRSRRGLLAALVLVVSVGEMLTSGRFGPVLATDYANNALAELYGKPRRVGDYARGARQMISFLQEHKQSGENTPTRVEALGGPLAAALPKTEGLAVTQGYNPMVDGSYARIIGNQDLSRMAKHFTAAAPFYDDPLFRLLSVRYVLMDTHASGQMAASIEATRARLAGGGWASSLGAVGSYEVWELHDVLPKVTLHTDGIVPVPGSVGSCVLLSYRNTRLRAACHADRAVTAVVGDTYSAGWVACVNGRPASVLRYAGLFRAVPLGPGDSEVALDYQGLPLLRHRGCG